MEIKHPYDEDKRLSMQKITINGNIFIASSLIDRSKDFPIFDLDIEHIALDGSVWASCKTDYQFLQHLKACIDSDLSYPVILNEDNGILDGWHRILKAVYLGKKTVKAVKFPSSPEPDIST